MGGLGPTFLPIAPVLQITSSFVASINISITSTSNDLVGGLAGWLIGWRALIRLFWWFRLCGILSPTGVFRFCESTKHLPAGTRRANRIFSEINPIVVIALLLLCLAVVTEMVLM